MVPFCDVTQTQESVGLCGACSDASLYLPAAHSTNYSKFRSCNEEMMTQTTCSKCQIICQKERRISLLNLHGIPLLAVFACPYLFLASHVLSVHCLCCRGLTPLRPVRYRHQGREHRSLMQCCKFLTQCSSKVFWLQPASKVVFAAASKQTVYLQLCISLYVTVILQIWEIFLLG